MPLSRSSSVMCSEVTWSIAEVDAGVTGADQRLLGLRLVDLDVFLQAMNEVFLEVAR